MLLHNMGGFKVQGVCVCVCVCVCVVARLDEYILNFGKANVNR